MRRTRATSGAGLLGAFSISVVLMVGIGVFLAAHRAHGQATPAVTPLPEPLSEFGRIKTQVRQVRRPNCWTLVVRGRLQNPYDEAVDGVRLIVRLRSAGETPQELERIETELSIAIDPGGSVPFNRELTTFCTTMFNDISVVAFANRRGAVELPAPPPEVELEAGKIQEVAFSAGNIPIINSPVAFPGFRGP